MFGYIVQLFFIRKNAIKYWKTILEGQFYLKAF